jgi:toxin ParE1/3/4
LSRRLVVRQMALTDLKEIYDYIAERAGDDIANDYVSRIDAATSKLVDYPDYGTPQDYLMLGLRSISFERRIHIFYLPSEDVVEIARVIHTSRDLGRIFGDPE